MRFAAAHSASATAAAPLRRKFRSTKPDPETGRLCTRYGNPLTPSGVRERVGRQLRKTGKKPSQFQQKDVFAAGLRHLGLKPHEVLVFAGYSILPWKMDETPHGFWQEPENRISAVKWMVEERLAKLKKNNGKTPEQIASGLCYSSFAKCGLLGLLSHYGGSPYRAAHEAYGLMPWEMEKAPYNVLHEGGVPAEAVRWLAQKTGKKPEHLNWGDFLENHLGSLVKGKRRGEGAPGENSYRSVYGLVSAAFPERNLMPWHMRYRPRGFFQSRENRLFAAAWVMGKLLKSGRLLEPSVLVHGHLRQEGAARAAQVHPGGVVGLLRDLGYEVDPERRERLLRKIKSVRCSKMPVEERRSALEKFISRKGPPRIDRTVLSTSDFFRNKKHGFMAWYVVVRYYDADPQKAMRELGLL